MVEAMAESVLSNRTASGILRGSTCETSLFWEEKRHSEAFACKARADIFDRQTKIIGDLKTCQDASPSAFAKDVWNHKYHWQAEWYLRGVRKLTGEDWTFVFIAVEKTPPFAVAVYVLAEGRNGHPVAIATAQIEPLLDQYVECLKSDSWPGYSDRVQPLMLPGWAKKEE